jgi:uncharacterized protein
VTPPGPAATVDAAPYRSTATGVRLMLRLTPGAGRDEIDGQMHDAEGRALLRVKVRARPVDGEANRALIRFLAAVLKVKSGDVTIASGETSRVKCVQITGDPAVLEARLSGLLGSPHSSQRHGSHAAR